MTRRWPTYSVACQRAVTQLLRRGGSLSAYRSNPQFPYGPRPGSWAWRLEHQIAQHSGVRHAIVTSSGTMALHAMLVAANIRGAVVATSPYTFSATPAAIIHAGCFLIFADVDPLTYCLSDDAPLGGVEAIVPVDLFGRIAPRIYPRTCSATVLADSCQAAGASREMYRETVAAVWSMNGQKNVPAGEAGAVLTDDPDVAERVRLFVSHGENWQTPAVGLNGRLNEITACVAAHSLRNLARTNAYRRRLGQILWLGLHHDTRVRMLTPTELAHHALYVYPFTVTHSVDRAKFVQRLRALHVEAGEGYIRPHLGHYPAFQHAVIGPLPVTEELAEHSLVLLYQIRPPTTPSQARYIAAAILAALDGTPLRRQSGIVPMERTAF